MGTRGKLPKNKLPVAEAPATTAKDEARERRWRAESALETMQKAEEHRKDKGLMSDVKALAKEKMAKMKSICGKDKDD